MIVLKTKNLSASQKVNPIFEATKIIPVSLKNISCANERVPITNLAISLFTLSIRRDGRYISEKPTIIEGAILPATSFENPRSCKNGIKGIEIMLKIFVYSATIRPAVPINIITGIKVMYKTATFFIESTIISTSLAFSATAAAFLRASEKEIISFSSTFP